MKCTFCGGKQVVDAGHGLERCPVCGGSGKDPFGDAYKIYEAGPTIVALNATSNVNLQIANHDFTLMFLSVVATSTSFTVLIVDRTTGYNFFNQQIHANNVFGTSQNPMVLPAPYKLKKNAILQFTYTDLSGAQNTIRPALIGTEDLNS